jgi:hypothetical protein
MTPTSSATVPSKRESLPTEQEAKRDSHQLFNTYPLLLANLIHHLLLSLKKNQSQNPLKKKRG